MGWALRDEAFPVSVRSTFWQRWVGENRCVGTCKGKALSTVSATRILTLVAREACSTTRDMGTDWAFAVGPRRTTGNVDRIGWSPSGYSSN
jgi:hypothetical protein